MKLPNEICLQILMYLSYIDLLHVSQISKRFYSLCRTRDDFKKSVSYAWNIFDDKETYFEILDDCRRSIFYDIKRSFSSMFKSRQYLLKCVAITLKHSFQKPYPYSTFCHRRIRTAGKCNLCTRFYVESKSSMILLKNITTLSSFMLNGFDIQDFFSYVKKIVFI